MKWRMILMFALFSSLCAGAAGDVVPRTRNRVAFAVEGPGEIVATDNGDETNANNFHQPVNNIFNGWAQAVVRARPGATGTITVTVSSPGLPPVSTTIAVKMGER